MTTLLLDTHVMHWWTGEPERLSPAAGLAIGAADEVVVASTTWYELAWLAVQGRIGTSTPVTSWLSRLATMVRTATLTPAIAAAAALLPESFPGDPSDRIIYATAMEHGWALVTKDARIRAHPGLTVETIW